MMKTDRGGRSHICMQVVADSFLFFRFFFDSWQIMTRFLGNKFEGRNILSVKYGFSEKKNK